MNVYQLYTSSLIHPFHSQCMDQVKKMLDDSYKLLIESEVENSRHYSRSRRLELIMNDVDGLWLDCDCLILKKFDFEFKKNRPYIMRSGCSAAGIFVNGNTDLIKRIYEEQKITRVCPCNIIKKYIDEFEFFPEGYIAHLQFSSVMNSSNISGVVGNKYYSIKKVDDKLVLTLNKNIVP